MEKQPEKQKQRYNAYIKYSSVGVQMIATILIFTFAGQWLDGYYNTVEPFFTVFLALFGVVASMVQLIRGVKKE